MAKEILITGASGFSGQYLLRYLFRDKRKIIAHMGRTPVRKELLGVATLYGNLASEGESSLFLTKPDTIIHLAAQSPGDGISDTDLYQNIPATYNIIKHAQKTNAKKIIYFSSTSLFGDVKGGVLYNNSPRINPDFYGQTKSICEGLLKDSGIPTISIRLPGIIGKGSHRNWLSQIEAKAKRGEPITIYNSEGWFNGAIHIKNLCSIVEDYLNKDIRGFNTILLGAGGCITVKEVVQKVVRRRSIVDDKGDFDKESFVINSSIQTWPIQATITQFVKDNK